MVQPLLITPTPPPTSGVVASSSPIALGMPAPTLRRLMLGWSNILPQAYGDVVTFDAARAQSLHARHASAVKVASCLPVVSLVPLAGPLSAIEDEWASEVSSTMGFLNTFGQQGWRFARVPLAQLVVWQPLVDAPRDDAPPLANEEEIIKALVPKLATSLVYTTTLSRDEQGTFHALLTSADPNHDVDLTLEDGGAGGLRVRLRPRINIVHAVPINGRLVVLNGYHRLARLAAAGHVDAPILLLEPGHAASAIADRPGFLPLGLIASIARPPLIPDFMNPDLTVDVPRPEISRGHDFRFTNTDLPIRR